MNSLLTMLLEPRPDVVKEEEQLLTGMLKALKSFALKTTPSKFLSPSFLFKKLHDVSVLVDSQGGRT